MDNKLTIAHKAAGPVEEPENETAALYEILKDLPKPETSMRLTTAQKKWWYWFGLEFIKTDAVSKLDLVHLQKAAFWMDARCQGYKAVKEKGYNGGLVQEYKGGATNVSGHVTIIEKADKHLDEVSAHFGLSIKDRSKLQVEKALDSGQLSLFDQVQKALNG